MNNPTALIDKNVIESLALLSKVERDGLLNRLFAKFQLVIPFVMIEEILANYDNEGQKIETADALKEVVAQLRPCWLHEDLELIFHELVELKRTPEKLVAAPDVLYEAAINTNADVKGLQPVLSDRRKYREVQTKRSIDRQKAIVPPGKFKFVNSEREFLLNVIAPAIHEPSIKNPVVLYLSSVARALMQREAHRDCEEQIKAAFSSYLKDPPRFSITTGYILAHLFYLYWPIYKIRDGTCYGRKIITRQGQGNNLEDKRYVACALMCSRLITQDGGMASIMRSFRDCGLWRGEVHELKPSSKQAISPQIWALTS